MDVIHYLEQKLDRKAEIDFLPIQPGDVEQTFADIEKSEKMLGYKPKYNIDIGIDKFIDWYKQYNKNKKMVS